MAGPRITPFVWYTHDLFEAIDFYTAVFPDSSVAQRNDLAPGVRAAEFTLVGQRILALEAARDDAVFNDLFSFMVECDGQAEVDRYWDALLTDGGHPQQCGWLTDRYGMRWQVVPRELEALLAKATPAQAAAVNAALLEMIKIDVATLEQAADSA